MPGVPGRHQFTSLWNRPGGSEGHESLHCIAHASTWDEHGQGPRVSDDRLERCRGLDSAPFINGLETQPWQRRNTANLNSAARESLANFAGVVVSYPQLRYNVEGHTDNTGSAAKNEELSLKRAIAVRDYLIAKGVAASATDVAGLGASTPIADNATADDRARNRRVEIVVSGGPLAK